MKTLIKDWTTPQPQEVVVSIKKRDKVPLWASLVAKLGYKWALFKYGEDDIKTHYHVEYDFIKYYRIKRKLWDYVKTRLNPEDIGSGIEVEIYLGFDFYTPYLTITGIKVNGRQMKPKEFFILSDLLEKTFETL